MTTTKHRVTGSRTWLYVLLGLMILSGIGLSLATEHMVRQVARTFGAPLERDVPALERFAAFKSALLLHQAALGNYVSASIDLDGYDELERHTLEQMHVNEADVAAELATDDERAALRDGVQQVEDLGRTLRAALMRKPADRREVRSILAASNAATTGMLELADRGRFLIEDRLRIEGRTAMERNTVIARLVHVYIAFAMIGMLVMLYHVRARIRSEDALAYLATHDELTRLPHRWAFLERMQGLRTQDSHLLVFEIDRFERAAAGVGPAHADELVRTVAARAADVAQDARADLFRLGDSKFALVLGAAAEDTPEATAARLQARLGEAILAGQHELYLSASIGSSRLNRASLPLSLLEQAEAALHHARRQGATHVAYTRQLDDMARSHLALEADLRHAIERGELELYYQPQQRLADGGLVGFEALLRWFRDGAFISPADFVPLAEESGVIVEIGDWVLGAACRQAHAWNRDARAPVTVAVNISPRQFMQPRFLERLRHHLEKSGVRPDCIELEITEGMLMECGERSAALLADIRALGVRLSVDDFGTGYSSLAYLKRFPLDKLKIDQTFVRQLRADGGDAEIVKAVIALGHNLGFEVIAEGVESAQQAELLARWRCDEIQGYHYGKPMPATAARAFLAQRTADTAEALA
nr:bifunctional diguanylate cyclase/phosphodiesterase [Massilia sp. JS1662]